MTRSPATDSGSGTTCSSTPSTLRPILRLGLRNRLPLHVAGRIRTAAGERHDVIDDVARTAVWIPGLHLELMLRGCAPLDPSVRGSRCGGRTAGARCLRVRAGGAFVAAALRVALGR